MFYSILLPFYYNHILSTTCVIKGSGAGGGHFVLANNNTWSVCMLKANGLIWFNIILTTSQKTLVLCVFHIYNSNVARKVKEQSFNMLLLFLLLLHITHDLTCHPFLLCSLFVM